MSPDEQMSPDALRKAAGLPPFQRDIFISFRFRDGQPTPLMTHLVGNLKKWLDADVAPLMQAEGALDKVQRREIEGARVIVLLLEEDLGVHRGNALGQQYLEISNAADLLYNRIDSQFRSKQVIEKETAMAYVVAYHFHHGKAPPSKGEAITRFLKIGEDGYDQPNAWTEELLLDYAAWRDIPIEGASANTASWQFDLKRDIQNACARRNLLFANGKLPGSAAGDSATGAVKRPAFDYALYRRPRLPVWQQGRLALERERRRYARESLEFDERKRMQLRGVLRTGDHMQKPELVQDAEERIACYPGSMVLIGQAGAGKTTVMAQAAAIEANRWGPTGVPRYPFVFSLKLLLEEDEDSFAEDTLTAVMARKIDRSGVPCTKEALRDFIEDNSCSLYFDGFDEIGEEQRASFLGRLIEDFGAASDSVRIILACRPGYETAGQVSGYARLRLDALSAADVDLYLERQPVLANKLPSAETMDALREVFNVAGSTSDAIRTPLFLRLYISENWLRRSPGSGPLVYLKTLTNFFHRLIHHEDPAAEPEDLGGFDCLAAFTQLAKRYVSVGRLSAQDVEDVAREGLESGPQRDSAGLFQARCRYLYERSGLIVPEGLGFGFEHAVLAEYLVARDIACRWEAASKGDESERRQILDSLIGETVPFERETPYLKLFDRIPCLFLDNIAFGNLSPVEALSLAAGFCIAIADAIQDAPLMGRPTQYARAAFLLLLRAANALKSSVTKATAEPQLRSIGKSVAAAYKMQESYWSPAEREPLLSAIADFDEAQWERIARLRHEPVPLESVQISVPVWPRAPVVETTSTPFSILRHPVLVEEFRAFTEAPDRYDHGFWPTRSREEKQAAETLLIAPARAGESIGANAMLESHDCIIGDVPLSNETIRRDWPEQLRRRHRPVTNVTWREAVAYALWRSNLEKRDLRLPGPIEWSRVVRELQAEGATEQRDPNRANLNATGLYSPSTVGLFPPDTLGLLDFGSNVSIWLASHDAKSYAMEWPPRLESDRCGFQCGPSYISDETQLTRRPIDEGIRLRRPWFGIWLIEF